MNRLMKFFWGSAVGALPDLLVGSIASYAGAALWAAGIAGFSTAALFTYVVHSRWTFAVRDEKLVSMKLPKFICSSLLSLGLRLAVLQALTVVFGQQAFPISALFLAVSIGISFTANYVLAVLFVFADKNKRA